MLDRHTSLPDFHRERIILEPGQRMLCLAPHPDDEILGSGGLLALARRQGLRVRSIIVTAGEQGLSGQHADCNPRLAESRAAAVHLGLPEPECWQLPDRQLHHNAPLLERITTLLREDRPHWLLLPALTEPHPDHQALALAGLSAAQAQAQAGEADNTTLLFYEVGTPTQVNALVDITVVADAKWQALQAFASQEERHAYLSHAQSLAALRAFGAGAEVQAAEAFWKVSPQALCQPGLTAALANWPLQRNSLGLASEPAQQPLISVLIRSMNRACLPQAVASVAQQTYANIEVLLINASGAPHPVPPYPAQRLSLRIIDPEPGEYGKCQPLGRSAAANLGLESAKGDFILFLDDDDLLEPEHINRLVSILQPDSQAVAAYSGVRVQGPQGQWLRDYDFPWERQRLRGINHLPIHAVLFRRGAAEQAGARFDESLPVLEDWDFWCQLSQLGRFIHVPGISAVYRQGLGESHLSDSEHANYWARWHQNILERHAIRWGVGDQSATLAWHALALDQAGLALEQAGLALEQARRAHADTGTQLQQAQQQQEQLRQQLEYAEAERDLARRSLELLQQSRPLRWARALRRLLGWRG